MRIVSRQQGASLFGLLLIGAGLVVAVVYGHNLISLSYHSRQIKTLMQSVVATEKTEFEARKKFDVLLALENISIVKSEDLEVEDHGGELVLSLSYRECAPVTIKWEVCESWELTTEK